MPNNIELVKQTARQELEQVMEVTLGQIKSKSYGLAASTHLKLESFFGNRDRRFSHDEIYRKKIQLDKNALDQETNKKSLAGYLPSTAGGVTLILLGGLSFFSPVASAVSTGASTLVDGTSRLYANRQEAHSIIYQHDSRRWDAELQVWRDKSQANKTRIDRAIQEEDRRQNNHSQAVRSMTSSAAG